MTKHQHDVMEHLWAGEHIYFNMWDARYYLSGGGKAITSPTFRALRVAGEIRSIGHHKWAATKPLETSG